MFKLVKSFRFWSLLLGMASIAPLAYWPREALKKELSGTVTMKFLIDVDGRVLEKEIVKSSGHEILDLAALEATARCKLTVAPKNGQLEKEWVMNQYVWTLD
ncbi:energy transducer TonB [Duganella sp. HH105]|uniref:energy transducer TonB n=1 Tax=Duganella sp. HH105 TaxID=1781067 RepID=UPI00114CA887|nr:energy transducer TonB [Duganella sp. HH105]